MKNIFPFRSSSGWHVKVRVLLYCNGLSRRGLIGREKRIAVITPLKLFRIEQLLLLMKSALGHLLESDRIHPVLDGLPKSNETSQMLERGQKKNPDTLKMHGVLW